MQRAKLFGALFAYVNNIQITWKTIHLSVFCRTNSPSTYQSRAEGNNTECVGKKRFNGRVLPTGFGVGVMSPFRISCYSFVPSEMLK
jgi:hypothetical protein